MTANGTPIWADLTVSDMDRSTAFYSQLLGWSFDEGSEDFGGYRTARVDGLAVGGLAPVMPGRPPEMAALDGAWMISLATNDVPATVTAMTAGGALVLLPAMEVGPFGDMAILRDPQGAAVALWHGKLQQDFEVREVPGAPCWVDLMTTDVEASKAFYAKVFNYTYSSMAPGDPYQLVHIDGSDDAQAGMLGMGDASTWSIAFQVADLDETLTQVADLGGTVLGDIQDLGFGRSATLLGPDSETVSLFQPTVQS